MNKVKNGKLCLIDREGTILIEPEVDVDTIYFPSHGLCQVEKNGKFGYINMSGELVIPIKYKKADPFSENGLAFVVGETGLGGYINADDEYVIDPIYESGSTFKFGFAAVSKNGEYIYIYKNGNKAINNSFKYASGFSDCGLAKTEEFDGRQGLMDTTSRVVLTLKKGCELEEFLEGTRITKFRTNGREALINAAGEIITGFYDQIIISPNSRLHPFLRNGLWGYIDNRGVEAIPNIYKEASEFEEYKDYKVASVKSYHPLAENNLVNLYINEKDEIIDNSLIEASKQHLYDKFSKVYRFQKALALAVKKEEGETEKSSSEGVKNMSEKHYHDELAENQHDEEYDEDYDKFDKGRLYEVRIYFKNMEKKNIYEFLSDELGAGTIVLEIKANYARILWPIDFWEDPADIENAMFYVLDDYRLGKYNYSQIDTYYNTTREI